MKKIVLSAALFTLVAGFTANTVMASEGNKTEVKGDKEKKEKKKKEKACCSADKNASTSTTSGKSCCSKTNGTGGSCHGKTEEKKTEEGK